MTGHDNHVLQVAFPPLVAHGAVVGMVGHQQLRHRTTKSDRLRVVDGNPQAVGGVQHAGHDDFALVVVLVLELFDGALPAGPG